MDGTRAYLSLAEETAGRATEDGGGGVGVELGGGPRLLLLLLLLLRGGGIGSLHDETLGAASGGEGHGLSLHGLAGESSLEGNTAGRLGGGDGGDARGALRLDDSSHYARCVATARS